MISAISTAVTFLWLQISYSGMFIQIEADVSVWVSRVVELHVCIVAAETRETPTPTHLPPQFPNDRNTKIILDLKMYTIKNVDEVRVCVCERIPQKRC